jgi:hypothetical protein
MEGRTELPPLVHLPVTTSPSLVGGVCLRWGNGTQHAPAPLDDPADDEPDAEPVPADDAPASHQDHTITLQKGAS